MASRNHIFDAIILRSKNLGSGDRILHILTRERGLVEVFLYGGAKSRLAALASPYVEGKAWIYIDPTRDSLKLTDFSATESNAGLREDLGRLLAAALVSETMILTHAAGGDSEAAFPLVSDTLMRLDSCPAGGIDYPLLHYLWHLVQILGLAPDIASCAHCGSPLRPRQQPYTPTQGSATATDWPLYHPASEGFLCPDCSSRLPEERTDGSLRIPYGFLRWLEAGSTLDRIDTLPSLDRNSLEKARTFLFDLARRSVDSPIRSLDQYLRSR